MDEDPIKDDFPVAPEPWRFKAVIEGDLICISATFGLNGIELFRRKLLALATVLDERPTNPGTSEESA